MVYRPKKKPISPVLWVVVALLLNAGVMAYLFWPATFTEPDGAAAVPGVAEPEQDRPAVTVSEPAERASPDPEPVASRPEEAESRAIEADDDLSDQPVAVTGNEAPLVIVPDQSVRETLLTPVDSQGRVPHLVELPLSFQKSVPDLIFNSHIYSSDPMASRVMINNSYLRPGDALGSLLVERVTEDGVILSLDGRRFRVGTVRDWVSPR